MSGTAAGAATPDAAVVGDSEGVPLLVHARAARVCCVGGGPVAAAKLAALLEHGADVRVVAADVVAPLRDAADAGRLEWTPRAYRTGDIGDAHLVVAATASHDVNATVVADADAAGRLCVRVDRAPGLSGSSGAPPASSGAPPVSSGATASFMATVRRGPLVLGVSTSGAAPAVTRLVRGDLASAYGPEWGRFTALCGALRDDPAVVDALRDLTVDERRARWQALHRSDILALIRSGALDQAKEAAYACLLSSSD